MRTQLKKQMHQGELLDRCLGAFIRAGTLDLSLDQLAQRVGTSKRMLVHYFGRKENIEHRAMGRLEDRLRAQFAPEAFPADASGETVVKALWERTTDPAAKGILLLVMDLSRRAWNGDAGAKAFYLEQQRLWMQLLLKFIPDRLAVAEILQLFQGAILAYLITEDPAPGKRALMHIVSGRSDPLNRLGSVQKKAASRRKHDEPAYGDSLAKKHAGNRC